MNPERTVYIFRETGKSPEIRPTCSVNAVCSGILSGELHEVCIRLGHLPSPSCRVGVIVEKLLIDSRGTESSETAGPPYRTLTHETRPASSESYIVGAIKLALSVATSVVARRTCGWPVSVQIES